MVHKVYKFEEQIRSNKHKFSFNQIQIDIWEHISDPKALQGGSASKSITAWFVDKFGINFGNSGHSKLVKYLVKMV